MWAGPHHSHHRYRYGTVYLYIRLCIADPKFNDLILVPGSGSKKLKRRKKFKNISNKCFDRSGKVRERQHHCFFNSYFCSSSSSLLSITGFIFCFFTSWIRICILPPLPPPPSRENKIRIGIYLSRLQASPVSGPPTTRQLHDLDNSWVVSDSLRIFTVNIQYRYHCVFICLGCQFVLVLIQKFNTIFVTNLSNGYR